MLVSCCLGALVSWWFKPLTLALQSRAKPVNRAPQPVFKRDEWFVTQRGSRQRNVCRGVAHISRSGWRILGFYLKAENGIEEADGLIQSGTSAGAHIDDFPGSSRRQAGTQRGINHIGNIGEIAR